MNSNKGLHQGARNLLAASKLRLEAHNRTKSPPPGISSPIQQKNFKDVHGKDSVRLGYVGDDKSLQDIRLSPSYPKLHQNDDTADSTSHYIPSNKTPLKHPKNPLNDEVKGNKEAYKKNIGRSH